MPFARTSIFLALAGALAAASGCTRGPADAHAAAQRLRRYYFQRDYESGYAEAPALLRRFPASTELRAWAIADEDGTRRRLDALAAVDSLARSAPGDRWTDFARALLLARKGERPTEALPPAERARAAAPWDPDMLWLRARVLSANARYRALRALIDSVAARHGLTPQLLLVAGEADLWLGGTRGDTTARSRALATAGELLRLDSLDPAGWLLRASVRSQRGDAQGRYDDVRRALALDSLSAEVHSLFWSAAQGRPGATTEQVRREVTTDVERFLRARRRSPGALLAAAEGYARLGLEARRDSIENEILAGDSSGAEAEAVAILRLMRSRAGLWLKAAPDGARAHVQLRDGLRVFLARPRHHDTFALGAAYAYLFEDARADTTVPASELVRAVEGLTRYAPGEVSAIHVDAPLALAERRAGLPYAEQLALEGRRAILSDIMARQEEIPPEAFQALVQHDAGACYDALGWVYRAEGKLGDARRALQAALVTEPRNASALYHLGRVEEALGHLAAAERLYARGYAAERMSPAHPSEAALKRLYAARRHDGTGYAAYVAKLQEQARAERRDSIVAQRLKSPRPVAPFRLARLGGGTVSSDTLRGRVGVINFWGTWCKPCVAEMPQIQQLYDRYRADADVVFLTVDGKEPVDAASAFVARKRFTFPVLLAGDFTGPAFVAGYPTTWFIGRDGRITYEAGASADPEAIVEEYIWRIETLRGGRPLRK